MGAAPWSVNQQSSSHVQYLAPGMGIAQTASSCCFGPRFGVEHQFWCGGGPRIGVFGDFPRPGDAIGSVQVTRGVGIRAGVEGSPLLIGE